MATKPVTGQSSDSLAAVAPSDGSGCGSDSSANNTRPVCGALGVSYWSRCQAEFLGVQVVQEGVCARDCHCYRKYDPGTPHGT